MFQQLFISSLILSGGACPLWTTSKNSSSDQCQCGNSLGRKVQCDSETSRVSVLRCYCMTYNEYINQTLVGECLVTCDVHSTPIHPLYYEVKTANPHFLNNETRQSFKRTGQLCGKCVEGYGPPVYSYSLKCVECSESHFKYNLLRYIAIAFGPLTLFYLVVVIFKIPVTSSSTVVYVLAIQITATPVIVKRIMQLKRGIAYIKTYATVSALWNLDILRSVYTPFCIHPKMTPLQVLALDYLVGLYPLFLIFLTYIAVSLHDRYSLVVNMWRPAYKCLSYFRREWDIRGSLVQAFATFLVLSYVKILNVSFDLLTPVYLQTVEGRYLDQPYLYNDGEVLYFGREHLPYGVLAIVMLTVFNILPVILLLVYPCKCFQKCLNFSKLRSHTLHAFMDAFQGCYRHHPRDCRYFAALYLFTRVLSLLSFAVANDIRHEAGTPAVYVLLAILLVFLKPHREALYNKMNVLIFLLYACVYFLVSIQFESNYEKHLHDILGAFYISIFVIMIYGNFMLLKNLVPSSIVTKVKAIYSCCCASCDANRDLARMNTEEPLPHRFHHQDEHSPLLPVHGDK